MARKPYTISWLPSDLLTSDVIDERRLRVSNTSEGVEDVRDGRRFTLTGEYLIPDGAKLALNITGTGEYFIVGARTDDGLPVQIRTQHATGTQDGEVDAVNMDFTRDADGIAKGRLWFNATAQGAVAYRGRTSIERTVRADEVSKPSIVVTNDTGASKTVFITAELLEFGDAALTVAVTYNGEDVTYNNGAEAVNYG